MLPIALLPAQFGIPGTMELAVILVIFLLFAVPIGLVVLGIVFLLRRRNVSNDLDDRLDELEAQIESLRDAVDEPRDR